MNASVEAMLQETASIFCVPISEHGTMHILVRPGEQTRKFKQAFPSALAIGSVFIGDDPVDEVNKWVASHSRN